MSEEFFILLIILVVPAIFFMVLRFLDHKEEIEKIRNAKIISPGTDKNFYD